MILYLWVNDYKHIKKTGFNFSPEYTFDFVEDLKRSNREVVGELTCVKNNTVNIFHPKIKHIKAIVGENGSGKSTIIEILVQNILTETSIAFDGFFITENYIFSRKDISFTNLNFLFNGLSLSLISNYELVNYNRVDGKPLVTNENLKSSHKAQIAGTYLRDLTIVHYSPLLNLDRVYNISGIAGSNKLWETNYWHYFDYTTENCIVSDYESYNLSEHSFISSESELLAHKSLETKRIVEFLSRDLVHYLPFRNRLKWLKFDLNGFHERFWESIDSYLKIDDVALGRIAEAVSFINKKDFKGEDKSKRLRASLFIAFIYGALKHEYYYRLDFGNENSNAINSTIELFTESTNRTRVAKTTLESFIKRASFCADYSDDLLKSISSFIDYVTNNEAILVDSDESFKISIENLDAIKQVFTALFHGFNATKKDDSFQKRVIFPILSLQFPGLSSGEKNLLSMFGRLDEASKVIPTTQKNVTFLLDEPEVTLHPQWQVAFVKLLNTLLPKIFPNKDLQIIITSHSPILLSDLPQDRVVFLEKDDLTGDCKISKLTDTKNTFGANVHSIYADAFFLKDKGGTIGSFARQNIHDAIRSINAQDEERLDFINYIISVIGEPLIKNQLSSLLANKFTSALYNNILSNVENMDNKIEILEKLLKEAKEFKGQKNANS